MLKHIGLWGQMEPHFVFESLESRVQTCKLYPLESNLVVGECQNNYFEVVFLVQVTMEERQDLGVTQNSL